MLGASADSSSTRTAPLLAPASLSFSPTTTSSATASVYEYLKFVCGTTYLYVCTVQALYCSVDDAVVVIFFSQRIDGPGEPEVLPSFLAQSCNKLYYFPDEISRAEF